MAFVLFLSGTMVLLRRWFESRGVRIVSVLLAGTLSALTACADEGEIKRQQQIAKDEARRDHFRIVGEVEIAGERIVYDEIIQIRTDIGMISTMGLKKGDNRTLISRLWIIRLLKDGGALIMETPAAWGLFTDLERPDEPPEPKWKLPGVIEGQQRPPSEIIPQFYWVDDANAPTQMEAYIAESYYALPKARLRIVTPIRIEYVPRTLEAERIATEQMEANPPVNLWKKGEMSDAWQGLKALELGRDVWTQIPDFALTDEQANASAPVALSHEQSKIIYWYTHRTLKWMDTMGNAYGVPQPTKFPDGEGIIGAGYFGYTGLHPEGTLPVECNLTTKVCGIRQDERGYYIFYKWKVHKEELKIDVDGTVLPAPSSIYVPRTGSIYTIQGQFYH